MPDDEFLDENHLDYEDVKTVVDRVVFYNAASKWGVLSVRNPFKKDPIFIEDHITLAGNFDEVYAGCEIFFSGNTTSNPKYGFQIALKGLRINKDVRGKESIINFLVKSSIKGISVANAEKIYAQFGEESIKVVLHDTEKLKQVKGINEGIYNSVKSSITEYLKMEELIEFCTSKNIPYNIMYRLYTEFEQDALRIIKTDIYSILQVSDEFSFNSIDEIALKLGFNKDDPARLRAALVYATKTNVMMSSSTGVSTDSLKKQFAKITGLQDKRFYSSTISGLVKEKLVTISGNYVYWKYYHNKEEYSAQILYSLAKVPLNTDFSEDIIKEVISEFPFTLNSQQDYTVRHVLNSRISVITGGAGTGKTTILKAVVNIFKKTGVNFVLLSPTGKATRRITECTNSPAYTIHKYLRATSASLEDVDLPVVQPNTAIIIDESSMLDILMLAKIMEIANITPIRLILVGDADQLPSVQVGNVLSDVVDSGIANVFKLTDIMRQAKDSRIIRYCADINHGNIISQCDYPDFTYTEFYDPDELREEFMMRYKSELKHSGYDLMKVQVITPYKKGDLGSISLNKFIHTETNSNETGDLGYSVGDKVMQVRNDYDTGFFNGECGLVTAVTDKSIRVSFPNGSALYNEKNIQDITMAYAATCHKSQGAEYPVVFIILDESVGPFLLTRRMLYTAISRGKARVHIYSLLGAMVKCIKNTAEVKRITTLREQIKEQRFIRSLQEDDIEEIAF